ASQSVILEFIDNKAVYTVAPGINEPSLGNIMTNFTNCLYAEGLIQKHACGIERWDILKENYASAPETFEGIQELMSKVWYSNAYTIDPSSRDFWFTDFSSDELPAAGLYKNYALCDSLEFCETMRGFQKKFADPAFWHTDDSPLWYTTHTSVYDMDSKTLHVLVHEGRDGQDGFYEAYLDNSSFAKPLKAAK
ncbi:MAG: hypothetical protein Q4G10_07595, partial [Bacteroidia bacterium]|nr:hypothetical protein [Bacteroidia bacterium]